MRRTAGYPQCTEALPKKGTISRLGTSGNAVEVAGLGEGRALQEGMDDTQEASGIQAGMLPGKSPCNPFQKRLFDSVLVDRTYELLLSRERSFPLSPAAEVAGTPMRDD